MKKLIIFILLLSSTSYAQYNGCLLLAVNAAQRQQFSQGQTVPGFQPGCLVQEIDDQTMYYWNGASYESIASTTGSDGVSTVNSIEGAVNIVAGSNITVTPSGQNITIAASGSSGANTALSNLVSTAVNAAINPGVASTTPLGTTALPWSNIESNAFTMGDGTNDLFSITNSTGLIDLSVTNVAAADTVEFAGGVTQDGSNGGVFGIVGNSAGATGGNGGDLVLENTDAASVSGSSGNVVVEMAPPSGGGLMGEIGLAGHISYAPTGYFLSNPASVTPQTGLGSGATASVSANSQDMGGILTMASGTTGLASGAQVIVTFAFTYNSGDTPVVQLTPANSSAGLNLVGYYITSTNTGFTINFATAPTLSTTYIYNYAIIGLQ